MLFQLQDDATVRNIVAAIKAEYDCHLIPHTFGMTS